MPLRDSAPLIAWWSGGVTSAVATKIVLNAGKQCEIYFFETGNHDPDTYRFMADCERWYGQKIHWLQNRKYKDIHDVFRKDKYLNGPTGARCTLVLKKEMRWYVERVRHYSGQVFGFENNPKEIKRAERFSFENSNRNPRYPLIENHIDKPQAIKILNDAGIKVPRMYKLGYHNNNCVGCVKGGMGYWNKIRQSHPEVFGEMTKTEQALSRTCLKETSLLELDPARGRHEAPLVDECGVFCEPEGATP